MTDASTDPIRVSIELEPGTEPVSGTINAPGSPPVRFVGWMELAHAIDGARALGRTGVVGSEPSA